LTAGLLASLKERDPSLILGFPLAILTMHLSWGVGFLVSLVKLLRRKG
jgi:hypothetical protein